MKKDQDPQIKAAFRRMSQRIDRIRENNERISASQCHFLFRFYNELQLIKILSKQRNHIAFAEWIELELQSVDSVLEGTIDMNTYLLTLRKLLKLESACSEYCNKQGLSDIMSQARTAVSHNQRKLGC